VRRVSYQVLCRCGHDYDTHQHYRSGNECALCECPHWSPPRWLLRRLLKQRHSAVDEERDHASAVRASFARRGLAQVGDGAQEVLGADVGADLAPGRRRISRNDTP
jgi:hypothetical protein